METLREKYKRKRELREKREKEIKRGLIMLLIVLSYFLYCALKPYF
jgi:hypothetical protein